MNTSHVAIHNALDALHSDGFILSTGFAPPEGVCLDLMYHNDTCRGREPQAAVRVVWDEANEVWSVYSFNSVGCNESRITDFNAPPSVVLATVRSLVNSIRHRING